MLPRMAGVVFLGLLALAAAGCGSDSTATVSVPDSGSIVINARIDANPNSATATCPTGTVTFRAVPGSLGSGVGKDTTQTVLGVLSGPPANHPDIENGSAHFVCEIERSLLNLKNGTWTASVSGRLSGSCSTTVRAGQASRVLIWNGSCTT